MSNNNADESPAATPLPAGDRRAFLRAAVWGGGIAGLGGVGGLVVNRVGRRDLAAAKPALGPQFTYDVTRFQTSDPALVRFDETGRFAVGLERARNLAVDASGAIYVCGTGGIRKFAANGEVFLTIPFELPVTAVATTAAGEILAGQAGRISLLDPAGASLAVWDKISDGLLPTAIAVAGERIFVADAGNRVVWQLDHAGKPVKVIGKRDAATKRARSQLGFVVPSPYFCLRLAPDGLLRVTNPGEHRIEAYTAEGEMETAWGKASFAVDGFCGCCNPVSFDMFSDGSFVTGEKGLPRVKLYDAHGEFSGLVAGPEAFPEYLREVNAGTSQSSGAGIYVAVDPQGRVLVLDVIGGNVRVMQRKEGANG